MKAQPPRHHPTAIKAACGSITGWDPDEVKMVASPVLHDAVRNRTCSYWTHFSTDA